MEWNGMRVGFFGGGICGRREWGGEKEEGQREGIRATKL